MKIMCAHTMIILIIVSFYCSYLIRLFYLNQNMYALRNYILQSFPSTWLLSNKTLKAIIKITKSEVFIHYLFVLFNYWDACFNTLKFEVWNIALNLSLKSLCVRRYSVKSDRNGKALTTKKFRWTKLLFLPQTTK